MRFVLPVTCIALALSVQTAHATRRDVGTGYPYAAPSDVPWESLAAGDTVLIHFRATPYKDKWVICRVGTAAAPIVVRGVPDGTGALPVIDGAGAVTRSQLNFWNEERGVIKIGGANTPPDVMPAYIVIENLDIRAARPENTFTGRNGLTSYGGNASAIYIEKGQHVTVRGCHLHDCSNGFFCASLTSDLLVESNFIEDNGNVGSIFEHNNYTEALGITFQYNHFGPLRAGAGGNNLKDRSAGCVIRYNWIEGGNRQLDLVESDFDSIYTDPSYFSTFVYGNLLYETGDDGNSQIVHYGGDGSSTANYRHGTLYFHYNTVVSKRTGHTTLFRLSTASESADVRDNVFYVTAAGNNLAFLDHDGALTATRNWLKTGWAQSFSGGTVTTSGLITGTAPGFVDFAAESFGLADGSACIDTAVALAAGAAAHLPSQEYVKHQQHAARFSDGKPDLGAFEHASAVAAETFPHTRFALYASPNPFRGACEVRQSGGALSVSPLEIFDARGRIVGRVAAAAAGQWSFRPAASWREGLYFVRAAGVTRSVVYLR